MRRVLILSYYFPPLGMGGTQRVASFARYLPEFGWEPIIVTVKPISYYAYDSSLLEGISHNSIYRTSSFDPARLAYLIRKLRAPHSGQSTPAKANHSLLRKINQLFIPDSKILWLPFLLPAAKKLINREDIHLILSSGPPFSSHLAAKRLARKFNIPFIADFRDTWAAGDFQHQISGFHQRMDALLEKNIVQAADRVIAVSEHLSAALAQHAPENADKFHVLTNGFHQADFAGKFDVKSEKIVIAHIGALGNFANPTKFLLAFKEFVRLHNLQPSEMEIQFVGAEIGGDTAELVRTLEIEGFVKFHGYQPHHRAIGLMQRAQILLYLIDGAPSPGFIPGKTFEYLAARKPILTIAKPVEGRVLIEKYAECLVSDPDDRNGILHALERARECGKRGNDLAVQKNDVSQFERKYIVQNLAKIMDELVY